MYGFRLFFLVLCIGLVNGAGINEDDVLTYTDEKGETHNIYMLPLTEEEKKKNAAQDMVDIGQGGSIFEKEELPEFSESLYPKNKLVHFDDEVLFNMGTDEKTIVGDGEQPSRQVKLSPFSIDKYEVSNGEFAEFVKATGHITEVQIT